jgi:arylsulfatase A-like enzyme
MPPDLLLVVCDTARADAFSPWGATHPTPTVERLSHEGVSWSNATAAAPWTLPSHASMFSGLLPTEHGINAECITWMNRLPTSPAAAVTAFAGDWLPEQLRDRGYRTWGASCNSWISLWGGFDRGFERFVDLRPWAKPKRSLGRAGYLARVALGRMDRGGARAVEEVRRRLADRGSEPQFLFVNLMETHAPFDPPSPFYPYAPWRRFRTRNMAGGADMGVSYNAGIVDPGADYTRTLREIYAACARYEDRILGQLVEAVVERTRPTVMLLVADHGENLGEHGLFNHNSSLLQTLLHVPMAAWGSGVEVGQGRIDGPTSTAAVGRFLVGLADGEPRLPEGDEDGSVVSEYEGTLRHNGIPDDIRKGIAEKNARVPSLVFNSGVAVRRGHVKYVAASDGTEQVYDLAADPGEGHDLAPSRPDLLAGFAPERERWLRRKERLPHYQAGEVAEGEIADHLRELGYIE